MSESKEQEACIKALAKSFGLTETYVRDAICFESGTAKTHPVICLNGNPIGPNVPIHCMGDAKPDEPKPMREMIHIDDHNFDLFMHVDDGCKEITIAPYGETFRYVDSGKRTERGIRMFCVAPADEAKSDEPEPNPYMSAPGTVEIGRIDHIAFSTHRIAYTKSPERYANRNMEEIEGYPGWFREVEAKPDEPRPALGFQIKEAYLGNHYLLEDGTSFWSAEPLENKPVEPEPSKIKFREFL